MDAGQWQKIEEIFHQVADAAPADRTDLARGLAGDDDRLFAEVMSLLETGSAADEAFDNAAESHLQSAVRRTMGLLTESDANSDAQSTVPTEQADTAADPDLDALKHLVESLNQNFQFRQVIGRGAVGTVVRVFDRSLQRDVAVKLFPNWSGRRDRIMRECRAIARLRSDYIVGIYDVGEDAAIPFLVMEWIQGPSLKSLINRRKGLNPHFAAQIARQVALGLSHAAAHGLTHRDIKPANILLKRKSETHAAWRATIIDFGLVHWDVANNDDSLDGAMIGTPAYMSPEQLLSPREIDQRSDVYSLGVVLYEMLVGEPPFRGAPHRIIRQLSLRDPTPPTHLDERLPKDLESVCLKALSRDRSARYQSARDLADDLGRFLDARPTLARPLSQFGQLYRWSRRNVGMTVSLASIAGLLILATLGSALAASVFWRKNQVIAQQRTRATRALCERIATAEPASLPVAILQFREQIDQPTEELTRIWEQNDDPRARINVACALTALGEDFHQFIVEQIPHTVTSPGQCQTIAMALSTDKKTSLELIREHCHRVSDVEAQVKLAIVALELGGHSLVDDLIGNPDVRTRFIHMLPSWRGDMDHLTKMLDTLHPPGVVYAVCLGLGLIQPQAFNAVQRDNLRSAVTNLVRSSSDNGVRGAAKWVAIRHDWVSDLVDYPKMGGLAESLRQDSPVDFEMVRIRAGQFGMGISDPSVRYDDRPLHPVRLTKDFWIADREVSVRLFRSFLEDDAYSRENGPSRWRRWAPDAIASPTEDHPAQRINWYDAIGFCNWLSLRHGLTPCYTASDDLSLKNNGKDVQLENWQRDPAADGYRLPTEAEFEYACRAGTQTRYFFGEDDRYLEFYCAWSNDTNVAAAKCGHLMPNAWGLFDMHGNVWEWTDDWFRPYPTTEEVDRWITEPGPSGNGRAYRGGGVCTYTGYPISSSRGHALPNVRYSNVGFRVARNAD